MARNTIYLYTEALDPASAVVTAQENTTAATFPTLTLGDTPEFTFLFTDGTGTWPTWAGDNTYTLVAAIGTTRADSASPLALQSNFTPTTGGWIGNLGLNTRSLYDYCQAQNPSQDYPVVRLWLQLRVIDPDGYEVSYAVQRVQVRLRTIPDDDLTSTTPPPSGTSAAAAAASAAAAATSASEAATSASSAATSASTATTKASEASASASAAAASATAASDSEAAVVAGITTERTASATLTNKDLTAASNQFPIGLSRHTPQYLITPADARAASDSVAFADADRYGTWWRNLNDPVAITDGNDDTFNLWPLNNVVYDEVNDILYVGYTSGPTRQEVGAGSDGKIAAVRRLQNASTLDPNDWTNPFEDPVTVFSEDDYSAALHGLYIIRKGRYAGRLVAIVSRLNGDDFEPNSHRYCYSDDQGATWTAEEMVDSSGTAVTGTWALTAHIWSDGRVMLANTEYDNSDPTNNVNTWLESPDGTNAFDQIYRYQTNAARSLIVAEYDAIGSLGTAVAWEPSVVEIGPGRALAVWRGSLGSNAGRILWSVCSDYGRNWSPWSVTDVPAYSNPAAILYDARTDLLELLLGDRTDLSTGGLYVARTTLAKALEGDWTARTQIRTPIIDNVADMNYGFYPALVDVGDKLRLGFFYDEAAAGGATEIYMLIGQNEARRVGKARPDKATHTSDDIELGDFGQGLLAGWHGADLYPPTASTEGTYIQEITGANNPLIVVDSGANSASWNASGYWEFSRDDACAISTTGGAGGSNITVPTARKGFIGASAIVRTPASPATAGDRIFSLLNADNGNKYWASLRVATGPVLGVALTADSSVASPSFESFNDGSAPSDDTWYCMSWSLDTSTGTVNFYLDGTLEATGTLTGAAASSIPSTLRVQIGGNDLDGNTTSPAAAMDWHSLFITTDSAGFTAMRTALTTLAGTL